MIEQVTYRKLFDKGNFYTALVVVDNDENVKEIIENAVGEQIKIQKLWRYDEKIISLDYKADDQEFLRELQDTAKYLAELINSEKYFKF